MNDMIQFSRIMNLSLDNFDCHVLRKNTFIDIVNDDDDAAMVSRSLGQAAVGCRFFSLTNPGSVLKGLMIELKGLAKKG